MPLLKREVEIFPPSIFELAESDRPWWVAHTRSRQEKAFARHLQPLSIPFYAPQRENRVRRAGRNRVSYIPLFAGYVFFRATIAERLEALRSRLLVRILEVPDQALLQGELAQLRTVQESGATLVPFEELHAGDTVRIAEGPFQGYSGVVLREPSRLRLLVSISIIRKTVAVEFDREVLRRSLPLRRETGVAAQAAIA